MIRSVAIGLTLLLLSFRPAFADPCESIPDQGPMPSRLAFAAFSGPVVHVIDGDSMCVALGSEHKDWVEVRLAEFYAPETGQPGGAAAKSALERLALGRTAACVANLRTYDRIAARCRIDGQGVGDMMRAAGISEGGKRSGLDRACYARKRCPNPSPIDGAVQRLPKLRRG